MYVDNYTIKTIGSKYNKRGKEIKNSLLTETNSVEGINLKSLSRFLEEYHDNLICGCYDCEINITFKESERE
tara:strand:- start:553 stop:768 length:216 start_codon:yes stop_codon:yes gene_type:complete